MGKVAKPDYEIRLNLYDFIGLRDGYNRHKIVADKLYNRTQLPKIKKLPTSVEFQPDFCYNGFTNYS